MPRRKATKSCQTDYVFMSEQQVENIVNQRAEKIEDELKKLQANQTPSKPLEQFDSKLQELRGFVQKLQEEVRQLRINSDKIETDLNSLNNLQQSTEILVEQLDGRADSIEEETEQKITSLNSRFETNNQEMGAKLDDVEQQSKLCNLRFFGLEEEEGEDPTRKVTDFVQRQLNIQIKPTEIQASRVGKPYPMNSKPRDILVRFDSEFLRNAIYKKKIILRESNQQVFINEDLTAIRSHLFFEARNNKSYLECGRKVEIFL